MKPRHLILPDGIGRLPRPGEPESSMLAGMAAPAPRARLQRLLSEPGCIGPDHDDPAPLRWQYQWDTAAFGTAVAIFPGTVVPTLVSPVNGIAGVTNGSNAAPGIIGEYLTASQAGVALATGTPLNAVTLSLTAGDWDVWGWANFAFSVGANAVFANVGTASATLVNNSGISLTTAGVASGTSLDCPTQRISLAATTNVFLVAQASFGSGTGSVTAQIYARRRR